MNFDPSSSIQDYLVFGEFGGVNPSITDSSTFTFLSPDKMKELFEHDVEGCFLYSRHWNPTNKYLSNALALMESTESAIVTASGMSAITCSILQLCKAGDEIISSHTIYGGTYALFKNFLPRFNIKVHFIDINDGEALQDKLTSKTKVVYCESMSNPLLEIPDIHKIKSAIEPWGAKLVVDNTFCPMLFTPTESGADVTIHSMTKFINGTSDAMGGCICSTDEFIHQLTDVNSGASMLLGPALDSLRAASILKNMHSLHIRMAKHSENALFLARKFQELGLKIYYPGLSTHKQHDLFCRQGNTDLGFGGMLALDVEDEKKAHRFMENMQKEKVGYLAVSLGYFKTLFSSPGNSTSSEIPDDEQASLGLSKGLVRMSIGLDHDIEKTYSRIRKSLIDADIKV